MILAQRSQRNLRPAQRIGGRVTKHLEKQHPNKGLEARLRKTALLAQSVGTC